MQPFTERSPEAEDQPDVNVRMTVQEAAAALGITVEAVRGRMHRGKYEREKAEDGRVYVVLTPDQLLNVRERSTDRSEFPESPVRIDNRERSGDRSSTVRNRFDGRQDLVEDLRDHIAFLRVELEARNEEIRRCEEEHREEARRKDTIIAQLAQRLPDLEAPSEVRDALKKSSAASDKGGVPPEQLEGSERQVRSWLHRFFFGP